MTDKETFFPNDTPILIFEARRPDPTRFDDGDGIPDQPVNVETRFYSVTDGAMVEIAEAVENDDGDMVIPLGTEGSLLYMVAKDDDEDRGALIYATVPNEVTSLAGNYTMYIRLYYGDGMKITRDTRIQVSEYR